MKREPVMLGGLIVAVLEMFILMCIQMGWISWDNEQVASFNNFIVALVALLAVAIPIVGAYIARAKVTPLADPHTLDGEPAELVKRA